MVPIGLDAAAIVLEGMGRLDELRRIRSVIPTLRAIPVAVGPWEDSDLADGAQQVLDLIDDQRTIDEICRIARAGELHVCRILFRQLQAKRLKVVRLPESAGPAPAPAPPPPASAESLLEAARTLAAQSDLEAAHRHLRAARALDPDNRKLEADIVQLEGRIRGEVERSGVQLTAVPVLARRMDELTEVHLTPQEGFLLTRIDGVSDLQSILRLAPLSQLDAQLAFWKLHRAGHVMLQQKK
jgi:hypothetical protein